MLKGQTKKGIMKNVSLPLLKKSVIEDLVALKGKKIEKSLKFFVAFCSLVMLSVTTNAQIQGSVFRDLNGNGVFDSPAEPRFAGIAINTYDANNNLIDTDTSTATGTYSVTCAAGLNRVEFIIPPNLSYYFPSSSGGVFGSNVQFVSCNATNINFGVSAPNDYCQANPMMASPTYLSSPGNNGTNSIAAVPVGTSGTGAPGKVDLISPYSTIGSVWGTAQQRTTNKLFTAAFMKRHAAFGTGGTGAIYITNNTNTPGTSSTQLYVDLQSLGINTGPNVHDTDLTIDANNANGSPYDAVGKVSLGDLDISQDGKYLFVTNLYERTIHRIFIDNPAKAPGTITAADVTTWDIPNPCDASKGDYRPWGLGIYNGKVYVGVVCDASLSGDFHDLTATVYQMDPNAASGNFTSVLSFPLDYTRDRVSYANGVVNFYSWNTSYSSANLNNSLSFIVNPQPIITDLDFDNQGNMIIGIADRFGHQSRLNGPNENGGVANS